MHETSQVHHSEALRVLLAAQLADIKNGKLSDDNVESLLLTCGDSMLLAALDLIDSNEVSRIPVAGDRYLYQCAGTSTTYSTTLEPLFCPCPAFCQQILYLSAHVVCKHLLACLLAARLDRFVDRQTSLDLLATLATH